MADDRALTWRTSPISMRRFNDTKEDNAGSAPLNESPECRICYDCSDQELGRLSRPCLCKGSISVGHCGDFVDRNLCARLSPPSQHVHVKCLQKGRTTSASTKAFWLYAQCHYRYHFARTHVSGLASNPGKFPRIQQGLTLTVAQ